MRWLAAAHLCNAPLCLRLGGPKTPSRLSLLRVIDWPSGESAKRCSLKSDINMQYLKVAASGEHDAVFVPSPTCCIWW
ncbi:hypothetical protein ABMA08_17925 [Pseudomonas yamanorum]